MSWKKIFKRRLPMFKQIEMSDIPYSLQTQATGPVFFTPHIQIKSPSKEFLQFMRVMRRKSLINQKDIREVTSCFIQQSVKILRKQQKQELGYSDEDVQKDVGYSIFYNCKANPDYHGVVDYIIFCRNFSSFVPILHFQDQLNIAATTACALWNSAARSTCKYGYAIQTNGNQWQLVRVSKDLVLQKSVIYQGGQDLYKKIYSDQQMQGIVLGLLHEGLQLNRLNRQALDKAYQYLDEKIYSEQKVDGEKNKASMVTRALQKLFK